MGPVETVVKLSRHQELGLLCHGAHPKELSPFPPSEVIAISVNIPYVPQDLAMSSGLGRFSDIVRYSILVVNSLLCRVLCIF